MSPACSSLGVTPDGAPVVVDLDRLIGSHACAVANSGGGKSGLIRRLLETTHGRVQHIVLDVEDEFYTLRQRYDYVIAGGEGADAPATVASAAGLARATLEHGFSLIVQLNDLGLDGSADFIGAFLDGLMHAPRDLWRPVLVTLDEAQRLTPRSGDTAATAGVKDLLSRGRKRGFTGLLATLSLPEIDARVRGLVHNWMLGGVSTALDRKTVADALGFAPSSAEARELQGLPPRTFWGYGPALSRIPVLFRVADVETPPVRPGQARATTPPPPEALRAILQGLASPAGDVRSRAPGVPDLDVMAIRAPTPSAAILKAARDEGFLAGIEEGERRGKAAGIALGFARVRLALDRLRVDVADAEETGRDTAAAVAPAASDPGPGASPAGARPPAAPSTPPPEGLTRPQAAVLTALAWWARLGHPEPLKTMLAAKIGWAVTGGNFKNRVSELALAGLVERVGDRIRLTPEGAAKAPAPDKKETLRASVEDSLTAPQRLLLQAMFDLGAGDHERAVLAARVGWEATGGNFKNRLSELAKLALVERPAPGLVRLSSWLRERL